jgi:ATP-dependent DNA ligase
MQERSGRYQIHRSSIRRDKPFGSDIEVRLILFDLLHLAGQSLLAEPYDQRRARLAALPRPDPYRVSVSGRSPELGTAASRPRATVLVAVRGDNHLRYVVTSA